MPTSHSATLRLESESEEQAQRLTSQEQVLAACALERPGDRWCQ